MSPPRLPRHADARHADARHADARHADARRRRPGPIMPIVAGALVIVLAGCAGAEEDAAVDPAELEALRDQVATLVERDAAREDRLQDLETTTEQLTRSDPSAQIAETDRELERLVARLSGLDEELAEVITDNAHRDTEVAAATDDLAEQNAALEDTNAQLRETVDELRGQLETARGRIDRVSGEVEDLEIRYETLRDRLDRAGR